MITPVRKLKGDTVDVHAFPASFARPVGPEIIQIPVSQVAVARCVLGKWQVVTADKVYQFGVESSIALAFANGWNQHAVEGALRRG